MSVAEIVAELPKLTPAERDAIARRLRDLEEEECIRISDDTAVEGAKLLDRMEDEDANTSTR